MSDSYSGPVQELYYCTQCGNPIAKEMLELQDLMYNQESIMDPWYNYMYIMYLVYSKIPRLFQNISSTCIPRLFQIIPRYTVRNSRTLQLGTPDPYS